VKPTGDGGNQAFDRLLGRELARPTSASGACPQVDLLSAWFDRALPESEAASVEAHLASCARCQDVLGQLARTEPEILYVHPKPVPTPWTWHLRWALPLAAASIVVFVVGTRQLIAPNTGVQVRQTVRPVAVTQSAENSDRALPAPPAASPTSAELPPGKPGERTKAGVPADKSVAGGHPGIRAEKSGVGAQTSGVAAQKSGVGVPTPDAAQAPGVVADLLVATVPSRSSTPASAPSALPLREPPKEIAITEPPAPATVATEVRKVDSPRADRFLALDARARAPVLSAFVPGGAAGWRYTKPGFVFRTLDAGTHWAEHALPSAARLLALSPVSSSVCWAAGAAGIILRTTDGATWQVIASPTIADIESIAALDDHRVTVRAADGVTYDTGDGGATWRRR
jgi:hypothetical protein